MSRRLAIKERVEMPTSSSDEDLPLVVRTRETQIIQRERRLLSKEPPKGSRGVKKILERTQTKAYRVTLGNWFSILKIYLRGSHDITSHGLKDHHEAFRINYLLLDCTEDGLADREGALSIRVIDEQVDNTITCIVTVNYVADGSKGVGLLQGSFELLSGNHMAISRSLGNGCIIGLDMSLTVNFIEDKNKWVLYANDKLSWSRSATRYLAITSGLVPTNQASADSHVVVTTKQFKAALKKIYIFAAIGHIIDSYYTCDVTVHLFIYHSDALSGTSEGREAIHSVPSIDK
eukprot:Ihof_evm11s112 gene=Ihof_evmTU11s112